MTNAHAPGWLVTEMDIKQSEAGLLFEYAGCLINWIELLLDPHWFKNPTIQWKLLLLKSFFVLGSAWHVLDRPLFLIGGAPTRVIQMLLRHFRTTALCRRSSVVIIVVEMLPLSVAAATCRRQRHLHVPISCSSRDQRWIQRHHWIHRRQEWWDVVRGRTWKWRDVRRRGQVRTQ